MILIDKEAFIKEFDNRCRGECCCCLEVTTSISGCKVIDEAPVIDAVPVKHGEWTVINGCVSCSVCGEPNMEWNYCPNCGAKMNGGKDDE